MSKQSSEYDRGYLESIARFVNILEIHSFLDPYHTSRSPLAASKEYNDGYISGCNYISSFLDKHRSVPRILYNTLSDEIEFRQRILGHTPKFKVDGKETPQEELSKTPIQREKVHVDAIGRIYTNKPDYSGPLAGYVNGNDQVSNIHAAETIQKATGENPSKDLNIIKNYTTREDLTPVHIIPNGLNAIHPGENIQMEPEEKPSEALNRAAGNSVIEDLAKATHVPVHLVKGPKDIGADNVNITTHNIWVPEYHFSKFKTREINSYITLESSNSKFSIDDQVIIHETSQANGYNTGDHIHVRIKEIWPVGKYDVLLLFDMSGDF